MKSFILDNILFATFWIMHASLILCCKLFLQKLLYTEMK